MFVTVVLITVTTRLLLGQHTEETCGGSKSQLVPQQLVPQIMVLLLTQAMMGGVVQITVTVCVQVTVLLQQVACQTWEMSWVQQLPLVCGGKAMSVRLLLLQQRAETVGGSNTQGVLD